MTKIENVKYITRVEDLPTLKEAQDYVGGYIEKVELRNGDAMLICEEGLMKGSPINYLATTIYKDNYFNIHHIIVGNVMVIQKNARDGKTW
tara:strand:- start:848 stop:1120 length:273 start_codon:yes stop_codon:yes gene_type:complete